MTTHPKKTPAKPTAEPEPTMNPEMEAKLLSRFDHLDNMASGDNKGERMGQVKTEYLAPPSNSAWYDKNVGAPQRLALFTMFCIMSYEVLVFASMGVKSLRWAMVNWLMYVMISLNVAMMLILGAYVYIKKKDLNWNKIVDLATGRGKEKQEFTV